MWPVFGLLPHGSISRLGWYLRCSPLGHDLYQDLVNGRYRQVGIQKGRIIVEVRQQQSIIVVMAKRYKRGWSSGRSSGAVGGNGSRLRDPRRNGHIIPPSSTVPGVAGQEAGASTGPDIESFHLQSQPAHARADNARDIRGSADRSD